MLHVESVPRWCKVDVPEAETLLAGQHIIGKRVWTVEAVQQGVEVDQGHIHLSKKETILISTDTRRNGKCMIMEK